MFTLCFLLSSYSLVSSKNYCFVLSNTKGDEVLVQDLKGGIAQPMGNMEGQRSENI